MGTTAMVQTCTFFFLECVSGADHGSKRGAGLDVELDQKCSWKAFPKTSKIDCMKLNVMLRYGRPYRAN